MIRSLWISKTGLEAHQTSMDVITNNLANVSSNGFKRSRPVFADLIYETLRQPGAASSQSTTIPSGLMIGTGVKPVSTEHIFTQGSLLKTDNTLDLAIQGNGFFRVTMPDGTFAYTRDGSFTKTAAGAIVNASGYGVETAGVTIDATATHVEITRDGNVLITTPTGIQQQGPISLFTFVNNGGLQAIGDNLFIETASSGAANQLTPGNSGAGLLHQGYVETSNVNVAEELVNMIVAQRGYEMNSKAITTADQMLSRLTQL